MIFARRRYYFWLFRAYIKKWKKTILSSLVLGVVICLTAISFVTFYLIPTLERKSHKTGYVGVYTPDTIPQDILTLASFGLTSVDDSDTIRPAAADHWQVKNNGKEYVFYLKHGLHFQ